MKYDVILADPPWRYSFSRTRNRRIENHYPTMAPAELRSFPIDTFAAQNCALFLWATSPKLDLALDVMSAWRFKYITCAVWIKNRMGMGYHFRQQHELLLIGKRGKVRSPKPQSRPRSIIAAERLEHSRKPEIVHDYIVAMYPDARRVELFARRPRDGWDVWGNEVEHRMAAHTAELEHSHRGNAL